MEQLLKPKAVCNSLGISQATLTRMIQAESIPCVILKTGARKKVVRFRERNIEAFLLSRTQGGPGGQGRKRKRGWNGNGVATGKRPSLEVRETQRENEEGHGTLCPVAET